MCSWNGMLAHAHVVMQYPVPVSHQEAAACVIMCKDTDFSCFQLGTRVPVLSAGCLGSLHNMCSEGCSSYGPASCINASTGINAMQTYTAMCLGFGLLQVSRVRMVILKSSPPMWGYAVLFGSQSELINHCALELRPRRAHGSE